MSATGQGAAVTFPCNSCMVTKDDLTNVLRPFPPRTIQDVRELVESGQEKKLHDEHSAFQVKVKN